MELSKKEPIVTVSPPYAKEIKDFIRNLGELSKLGKLDYYKDSFWSIKPAHLGKTNS